MQLLSFNRPPQEQEPSPLENKAALVAIGGLGTVKRMAELYGVLLKTDDSPEVDWKDRFIVPPNRGNATPEEISEIVTQDLEALYKKLGGRKMWLAGHSLGALIATRTGYERPDLVQGVSAIGGVHTGYEKETPATLALRYAFGNPEEAKHLKHDSDFMQGHIEKMATEWPVGMHLDVIATPLDILVVPPKGFDVELAHGQPPDKRLVVSPIPGSMLMWRVLKGIPADVKPLKSPYAAITEHVNLVLNPQVISHINASRCAETTPIMDANADFTTIPSAA